MKDTNTFDVTIHFVEKHGDMIHLGTYHHGARFFKLPEKYFDKTFVDTYCKKNHVLSYQPIWVSVHQTKTGAVDLISLDGRVCFSRSQAQLEQDCMVMSRKVPHQSVIAKMLDHFMEH